MPENLHNLQRRFAIGLILGLAVVIAITLLGDLPRMLAAFGRWRWALLPFVLAAVLVNYVIRFCRWEYYLQVLQVGPLGRLRSLGIFLTGFALTMTPGKLGEVVKSFFLRQAIGTAVSASAPIVLAERLTDVLGVVLLAALGLTTYQVGGPTLAVAVVGAAIFVALVQQRQWVEAILSRLAVWRPTARFATIFRNLYESTYALLAWRPLVVSILLAAISWFGECVAFFLVLWGFGLTPDLTLLLQATFIYAVASLLGALSFLPGGLGATEGVLAVLLVQLVAMPEADALAATLIVRFCTLWFAVILGLLAMLTMQRRQDRPAFPQV